MEFREKLLKEIEKLRNVEGKDLNEYAKCGYNIALDDVVKLLQEKKKEPNPRDEYFTELATNLRKLWPKGEKDGKFPWRDSVGNIKKRLEVVWDFRKLEMYSMDKCLRVARRYLAQYQMDTKYMCILKYFVLKQTTITKPDGKKTLVNTSKFADMLEDDMADVFDQMEQEQEQGFEAAFVEELI